VRAAVKERGFRSEQAFLIAACQNELERGDSMEATYQLEARVAATLANMANAVTLHLGTHSEGIHEFPVAVRSDVHD
jgi:hypothetical protein